MLVQLSKGTDIRGRAFKRGQTCVEASEKGTDLHAAGWKRKRGQTLLEREKGESVGKGDRHFK